MATGQPYTITRYTVKEGRENAFKSAWENMAREAMRHYKIGGNPRLLQDPNNPRNVITYAEWIHLNDIQDWMQQPYFKEFVQTCQELCESIDRNVFNVVLDLPIKTPEFEKVKRGR
ncbi:MAG TPA: hypothetical protein DEO84_05680 [candidate division Zixibacteria bacterium]|nr:hypothetical protein [candidate division Zixibacteria bacterium]HBZ00797.1 hypothetical protein [candidate division Zixibacteria bacterium]